MDRDRPNHAGGTPPLRSPSASPDREFERERWSASSANWDRWADPVSEAADRINRPLLAAAGLNTGDSVLDLASGAGEPALTAAELVGTNGTVIATDFVPGMLDGARRRMAERGIVNLRFAAADMEALPFPGGVFDRVTCRFGLMFVPDAARAAAEIARVLRPGGVAVAAVWGPLEENTLFRELAAALDEVLGPDPAQGLAALFRFGQPGSSAAIFAAGGLTGAAEETLRYTVATPASRPFWRPTLEMAFAPRLALLDGAARQAVEQAAGERFGELAGADGLVPLNMHIRVARGIRG
ncbi:class I SAM-dependent methyltransferase [Indioceanicola profundi]|uniref:class I SAM-dependent methyltransferase n=1 Tax=Indioceanicola profundi TaxID=2220096 RepID=UPI000E6AAB2E|nr:methyltransferase domain-containing protein [Indioceanicola profundi]